MPNDMPEGGAKPIIALDADGVLLDYHAAYRQAWGQAFGELPELRDPMAYWPMEHWDVRHLEGDALTTFRRCFNQDYWASIPAIPGAVRACEDLCNAPDTNWSVCPPLRLIFRRHACKTFGTVDFPLSA